MRARFPLLRIVLMLFALVHGMADVRAATSLTGTYLVDARPTALLYLALIQNERSVSGAVLQAAPDGTGGTQTTSLAVAGPANESVFVLEDAGRLILSGRLGAGGLEVTLASDSGAEQAWSARQASPEEFNRTLGAWQLQLRTEQVARQREPDPSPTGREPFDDLAARIEAELSWIREEGTMAPSADMQSQLQQANEVLAELQAGLQKLKASAGVRPANCNSNGAAAGPLGDPMPANYEQNIGNSLKQVRDAAGQFSAQLAAGAKVLKRLDAEIGQLEAAIRKQSAPSAYMAALPAKARQTAQGYRQSLDVAKASLPGWKLRAQALAERGRSLLRQAHGTMRTAQNAAKCKSPAAALGAGPAH
jgi:hypothetical protein